MPTNQIYQSNHKTAQRVASKTSRPQDRRTARQQDPFWYAIYTKPRWEKKVCSILEAAGVVVFLPLIQTIRQWSDRKKKVSVPLIASYVFVKIKEKQLNTLLKYNGVVGILKYLKKPAVVQGYEIENLKIICQNPDKITSDKIINVKRGEPVQITNGPMIGLYGECVDFKGKNRLIVAVKNLGLEFVLDIPLTYIEPLKNNAKMSC